MLFIETLDTPLKHDLLKNIYFEGFLSCSELSDILNKSIPVIAKAIAELIEAGVLVEKGYAASTGGRKPVLYSIKHNNAYILAVSMDQLNTHIYILDASDNTEIYARSAELKLLDNITALSSLETLIKDTMVDSNIPYEKFIGIGLGMPGFINTKSGINYSYLHPQTDESLREYLERVFQIQVYVGNDSNVIALAESKFGLAKGKENVMVINIGWGIGLGMIINGKLFRGHKGYAGEFSHIPLSDSNVMCDCGKRGCMETEATLRVVAKKAIEDTLAGKTSNLQLKESVEEMCEEVMDAANKGDQFAIELLSDMAYKIGKGIAILIHVNNPEQIILSGRGSKVGRILLAPIQQALNEYCIPRLIENTELNISTLKEKAYKLGTAALVMENLSLKGIQMS